MALVVKDRVKVYSSTTGTGTLSLGSAFAGFQTFNNALGDGDTTYYGIFESSTGNWEVGLGTYTSSGNTLSRDTILESSNAGAAVNLTADTEVFITYPAEKSVYFDANGDVNLNRDPQSALQAATKQYVDTIAAAGIHYHDPVRVESPDTAGNLTATYNNGSSGVGATLTNAGTQAALVIDGVTVSTNDRVLIYSQTNGYENGVYTVTNTGSASTNWVLTRATDADSYGPSDPDSLGQGDAFFVKEGDTGAGELYVMNTAGEIVFGTTDINFIVVAETAVYSAGNGLSLSGTEFNVGEGTGITVNATTVSTVQDIATSATPTFNGLNTTGNITFGDSDEARFGAGSDLRIYHNGSNSIIWDEGVGNLQLVSSGASVDIIKAGGENMATFATDGAVTLYYDNAVKIATSSTGIDVSGSVTLDANNYINWNDGSTDAAYIRYYNDTTTSNADRLDFYHSSTSSGTAGYVQFYANGTSRVIIDSDETWNTERYTTDVGYRISAYRAAAGIPAPTVYLDITQTTFDAPDNFKILLGTGDDLELYHDATNSIINNKTGDLQIQTSGSTKLTVNSTGIDVTGTVTADGLTVDGTGVEVVSVNSTQNGAQINFDSASTSVDWSIGISNSADGDFLIYQSGSGSGDILLYTGGAKRQEINRNGDISFYEDTGTNVNFFWDASTMALGIGTGTTTPTNPLTIQQTSVHWPYIALTNSSGVTKSQFGYQVGDDLLDIAANSGGIKFRTNNTETMRLSSSGVLSVGNTSPKTWHSNSTGVIQFGGVGSLENYNSTDDPVILSANVYRASDGNFKYIETNQSSRISLYQGEVKFQTAPNGTADTNATFTERFTLTNTGNVGIGTSSPSRNLYVSGGSGARADVQVSYDALGTTANDGAQFGIQSGGAYLWNFENSDTYFAANNTVSLRLKSGGYALFERSGKSLYVNANYSGLNTFAQIAPPNTDGMDLSLAAQDTREEDIYIKNSTGYVGMGTTSPASKLNVYSGTDPAIIAASDDWGEQLEIHRANSSVNWPSIKFTNTSGELGKVFVDASNDYLMYVKAGGSNYETVWTSLTDGSGSGLDADLLDGLQASRLGPTYEILNTGVSAQWVKLGNFAAGQSGKSCTINVVTNSGYNASDAQNSQVLIRFKTSNNSSNQSGFYGDVQAYKTGPNASPSIVRVVQVSTTSFDIWCYFGTYTGDGSFYTVHQTDGTWTHSNSSGTPSGTYIDATINTMWHSGNDGSGSGLDADTVDGIEASSFLRSDASDIYSSGTLTFGSGTGLDMATNDAYANMRVIRNANSSNAGLFLGYANGGSANTYLYGGGSNSATLTVKSSGIDVSGPVSITGDGSYVGNYGYSTLVLQDTNGYPGIDFRSGSNDWLQRMENGGDMQWHYRSGGNYSTRMELTTAGVLTVNGNTVWHSGNATGAGYVDTATGNYGTIKVDDDRGVTWAGYAIRDDWVFMGNGAAEAGIYNDTDNEWAIKFFQNGQTSLYYNGSGKLSTTSGGVAVTGALTATGDITAYFSDERLKDFDGKIEGALDKVSQLNGYYYRENDKAKELGFENDDRQVGVSAQEVEAVLPEVIKPAPVDPEYKTVQYEKLVPLLIEAIKELKEEVRQLKEDKA